MSTLPDCPTCDQKADPRFYYRGVMMCDGCWPGAPSTPAWIRGLIDRVLDLAASNAALRTEVALLHEAVAVTSRSQPLDDDGTALWGDSKPLFAVKSLLKGHGHTWRLKGCAAMEAMERRMSGWSLRWPGLILQAHVDDDAAAGARMYFILDTLDAPAFDCHVLFIPQCTFEDPIMFGMYAGHFDSVSKAMRAVGEHRNKFPLDEDDLDEDDAQDDT